MAKPFISIITCTKNSERFLKECLDSVSRQTYRNFEHVFVDGFSQDGTIKIIEDYIRENPDIIARVIQSEPKGIADAMNVGIRSSQGEVLHFLHSDDYYYSPESLDKVVKLFEENPGANVITGNDIRRVGNRVFVLTGKNLLGLIIHFMNKFSHPNTFMKMAIFNKYGLFDETFKIAMDVEHFYKWNKKEKIISVDDNFTIFRHHQKSISAGLGLNKLAVLWENFRLFTRKR